VEEEKKNLEERRLRTVNAVINEVINFRVVDGAGTPLHQVHAVLRHLDMIESLYPHLKALYLDKPGAASPEFQARCETLVTWSNVLSTLRQQITLLRQWTGSENLDVTERSTPPKTDGSEFMHEPNIGSTFVERLMKEETIQRTFEKGFLTTVHALIASARDTSVNHAEMFKQLNLPTFENELVQLISFPTSLVYACLRLRLDYANKVTDPDVIVVDQMLEDFRLTIGLACTLKRQYEAFLLPDPDGNWNLPSCISEDYDTVVLEALSVFFRLINWKLKSGSKDIYFRETDVLEAQWATFNDVSLVIPGGATLVAEQIW
jgi:mitogen-activated protein kinase kinase kinase